MGLYYSLNPKIGEKLKNAVSLIPIDWLPHSIEYSVLISLKRPEICPY